MRKWITLIFIMIAALAPIAQANGCEVTITCSDGTERFANCFDGGCIENCTCSKSGSCVGYIFYDVCAEMFCEQFACCHVNTA